MTHFYEASSKFLVRNYEFKGHAIIVPKGRSLGTRLEAKGNKHVINPRRACAARVTVVVLCVCVSVCLSVCQQLFSHHGLRGGL